MQHAFVGSEALQQGRLSGYELRTKFRTIFPDVYVADYAAPSLRVRSEAAWMWSRRRGVLTGLAAAAFARFAVDLRRRTHRIDLA
jgi:hypothetical protein